MGRFTVASFLLLVPYQLFSNPALPFFDIDLFGMTPQMLQTTTVGGTTTTTTGGGSSTTTTGGTPGSTTTTTSTNPLTDAATAIAALLPGLGLGVLKGFLLAQMIEKPEKKAKSYHHQPSYGYGYEPQGYGHHLQQRK